MKEEPTEQEVIEYLMEFLQILDSIALRLDKMNERQEKALAYLNTLQQFGS